jgi:hypothetical protein
MVNHCALRQRFPSVNGGSPMGREAFSRRIVENYADSKDYE